MRTRRSRKKIAKENSIDRISYLPDPILCKILSLLPTKYAVRTSVLSTRWNSLFPFFWNPPIKLEFNDDSIIYDDDDRDYSLFTNFVSKWLKQPLLDATGVDTVNIYCKGKYDYFMIKDWIDTALRLNVKHLDLRFRRYDAKMLFLQLEGCTSLVSLDICIRYGIAKLPGNFSLPNLKRLNLRQLAFYRDAPSLSELIAGCPMLEDLVLSRCDFQSIDIIIRSPLLKYFKIYRSTSDSTYSLDLDAPNLQKLVLVGCMAARQYRLSTFKSLRAAYVEITELPYFFDDDGDHWDFDNAIVNIVNACASTRGLYLDVSALEALHRSSLQLPTFENLTWLSLNHLEFEGWAVLARLLHCAPTLAKLTFREEFRKNRGAYSDFERLVPSPPICLELHLKEIELRVFNGKKDEMKLLEYFLKNGKVLEKASLDAHPSLDSRIVERLTALPNHSKIVLYPGENDNFDFYLLQV